MERLGVEASFSSLACFVVLHDVLCGAQQLPHTAPCIDQSMVWAPCLVVFLVLNDDLHKSLLCGISEHS